ncbi:uncharacterized protein LOC112603964 [Melanaphis sacchari]|uniref:uncharacterized protein LOC112603964 n=1 Tax=Melanaphis sacchari TaxID=742174 RepID=UPI000DC156EC|nr:uncharacterized protein LOC112603964 [Melanaphis sacchari]
MEAAEVQAPAKDPNTTREYYEEELVQLNRRLADARTEHHQARDALDASEAEYVGTKERREMVLGENGRLIVERQQSVDRLVAEKQRLMTEVNSYWAVVNALYERRQVQYEQMLARLKEDTDFVRTKYEAATQRIEQRATMMDKITRVLENSNDLKQKQQEGMYANRQILTCSMHKYTEELERYIGNYFETVLLSRSDILNQQLMTNIKEYYNIVKQFDEYRRNYIPPRKNQEFNKLYQQKIKTIIQLRTQKMMAKELKKENYVPEKTIDLHQEQSNIKIDEQRENPKYEPPAELERLRDVIKLKRKLIENTTQQIITEKESREWKCNYLKEMFDEIRTIVDKANQYVTGEKQPTSYDQTNLEWLLNRGAVRHFSTCKTGYIQTYDYDVELNVNLSSTECKKQLTDVIQ